VTGKDSRGWRRSHRVAGCRWGRAHKGWDSILHRGKSIAKAQRKQRHGGGTGEAWVKVGKDRVVGSMIKIWRAETGNGVRRGRDQNWD
jgi:hypothetical protein